MTVSNEVLLVSDLSSLYACKRSKLKF